MIVIKERKTTIITPSLNIYTVILFLSKAPVNQHVKTKCSTIHIAGSYLSDPSLNIYKIYKILNLDTCLVDLLGGDSSS